MFGGGGRGGGGGGGGGGAPPPSSPVDRTLASLSTTCGVWSKISFIASVGLKMRLPYGCALVTEGKKQHFLL